MPELRKDPIVDRWIIISTERARRPGKIVDLQRNFSSEVLQRPVKEPLLRSDQEFLRRTYGLYSVINGYGVHDIIKDVPENIVNMADASVEEIQQAINSYARGIKNLEKNIHLKYAFVFKKYLGSNKRTIQPSYAHLVGSAVIPIYVKEKLSGAKNYFDQHQRSIFTDMINQESETKVRIIMMTDHFVALTPFASRFPFEIWIIPKKHHHDFFEGVQGLEKDLAVVMKDILMRYKIGLDDPAYSFVVNSSPFIRRSNKMTTMYKTIEKDYCWHIELKPKLTHLAGFEKGTGFYICTIPPDMTANYLRKVKI